MTVAIPVDRHTCTFLTTREFVMFRKTCRDMYNDEEAWSIRTMSLPIRMPSLGPRHLLGLHYLLRWAIQLGSPIGSRAWVQSIAEWLDYKVSIQIVHSFFLTQSRDILSDIDMTRLSSRQQFLWEWLSHRSGRLYKRKRLTHHGRRAKRPKTWIPNRRIMFACHA